MERRNAQSFRKTMLMEALGVLASTPVAKSKYSRKLVCWCWLNTLHIRKKTKVFRCQKRQKECKTIKSSNTLVHNHISQTAMMITMKPFCSLGRSQEICGWHTPALGWVKKTRLMDLRIFQGSDETTIYNPPACTSNTCTSVQVSHNPR